jgi:DNA-directed RNA polymerase subunit RPC12/RpoP
MIDRKKMYKCAACGNFFHAWTSFEEFGDEDGYLALCPRCFAEIKTSIREELSNRENG